MTNNNPITPPPELRQLWAQQAQRMDPHDPVAWLEHVATQAARWGADQELEACCKVLEEDLSCFVADDLRAARRPKPLSKAESALEALEHILRHSQTDHGANTIRQALQSLKELEALPND